MPKIKQSTNMANRGYNLCIAIQMYFEWESVPLIGRDSLPLFGFCKKFTLSNFLFSNNGYCRFREISCPESVMAKSSMPFLIGAKVDLERVIFDSVVLRSAALTVRELYNNLATPHQVVIQKTRSLGIRS